MSCRKATWLGFGLGLGFGFEFGFGFGFGLGLGFLAPLPLIWTPPLVSSSTWGR